LLNANKNKKIRTVRISVCPKSPKLRIEFGVKLYNQAENGIPKLFPLMNCIFFGGFMAADLSLTRFCSSVFCTEERGFFIVISIKKASLLADFFDRLNRLRLNCKADSFFFDL